MRKNEPLRDRENCLHGWVEITRTPNGPNYGERRCKHCQVFMGVQYPPDDVHVAGRVRRALERRDLSQFEKEFLWSIRAKKTLTVSQHKLLKQISERDHGKN